MLYFARQALRYLILKKRYPGSHASFHALVALNTKLGWRSYIQNGAVLSECIISRYTYIGEQCHFKRSKVGAFTSVGPRVTCGLASHPVHFASTYPGFYTDAATEATWFASTIAYEDLRAVVVGADVWIGACAIILGGVRIGHGAVIGAGAVVTKDVPPYGIVGGVPARIIRYRFEERVIQKMLKARWWEAPESVIKAIAAYAAEPEIFLEHLGRKWISESEPKD